MTSFKTFSVLTLPRQDIFTTGIFEWLSKAKKLLPFVKCNSQAELTHKTIWQIYHFNLPLILHNK